MPRKAISAEEKAEHRKEYNKTYYEKHRDKWATTYQAKERLPAFKDTPNPCGVYVAKSDKCGNIYIGASRNIKRCLKSVTIRKRLEEYAPYHTWTAILIKELPQGMDFNEMRNIAFLMARDMDNVISPIPEHTNEYWDKLATRLASLPHSPHHPSSLEPS